MTTSRHSPMPCRVCGSPNDAATNPFVNTATPRDGSFAVCFYCGEVSVFVVKDGRVVELREPTYAQLMEFQVRYGDVARMAAEVRARRGPPSTNE